MLGSECDLYVRNLGYALPYNLGTQNYQFSATLKLNGKLKGLYLRKETRYT